MFSLEMEAHKVGMVGSVADYEGALKPSILFLVHAPGLILRNYSWCKNWFQVPVVNTLLSSI